MNEAADDLIQLPAWSRNFGEWLDDHGDQRLDDSDPPLPLFHFSASQTEAQSALSASAVVVAVGAPAVAFVRATMPVEQWELVGTMVLPDVALTGLALSGAVETAAAANIYRDAKTGLVVVTSLQKCPPDRAFDWTRVLFEHVVVEPGAEVLVLATLPDFQYECGDSNKPDAPWLRSLRTTAVVRRDNRAYKEAKEKQQKQQEQQSAKGGDDDDNKSDAAKPKKQRLPCPLLEAPNMLHALPAAILAHCEVHQWQAQLVVSLFNNHMPLECAAAFETLDSSVLLNDALRKLFADSTTTTTATTTTTTTSTSSTRKLAQDPKLRRIYAACTGSSTSKMSAQWSSSLPEDDLDPRTSNFTLAESLYL